MKLFFSETPTPPVAAQRELTLEQLEIARSQARDAYIKADAAYKERLVQEQTFRAMRPMYGC